jgi:Spy/CpxP family protein refolding chaperone
MRRIIRIGTLGLMALLAAAIVVWGQDGPPPAQGQHQWDGGPRRFAGGGPGQFAGHDGGRGGEGRRMGWQRGGRARFGRGGGLARLAENPRVRQYLGLSDDQVGRLHKIGIDAEKTSVQERADMQLRHIELGELMRAANPDHDAIMQKLDEVNALRGKMQKERMEAMLSARSVLTADQLKKLKTMRESFRPGGPDHRPMMERRGGAGRPGGGSPNAPAPKPTAPPAQ